MSFPRYPKYKASGVEWLGEVPEHWKVARIKDTTYLKGRVGWKGLKSDEYLDEGFAYLVTGTDFVAKYVQWDTCHCVEKARYDDDPFIQLRNGDLLITKDGSIGKLALVSSLEGPACLNSGIFLVRPLKTYTTNYMYWTLSSKVFETFCDLASVGSTIQHLYQNVFERFSFPAPPIEEQAAIAAFLDRETAKIDALVAVQRQLIELLREKRHAIISQAVTKGLNPDAPMKPSGTEWLGDVPAHWEVTRLKRIVNLIDGDRSSAYPSDDDLVDEGIPFLSSKNIVASQFSNSDLRFITREKFAALSRGKIQHGDLAITVRGTIGHIAIYDATAFGHATAFINAQMMIMRPNEISSDFVHSITESDYWQSQLDVASYGSAQQQLSNTVLREVVVVVPPADERDVIGGAILSAVARIDALAVEAQRAIDLLRERRTALISAAVTGKIDVRELARTEAA